MFREDPSEALYQFIAGLNTVERNGKSALGVLADLEINEIRQRDALLRLANASDIVRESLDNADTAWDENIALTKEAEQRYRTFNSRLQMTKNRINDVGISLYQDFQEPLSDLMGVALDASEDLDIFDDEFIKDMADAATEYIPTAVRECKELRNAVGDFAGPLVSTAINNMDLIGSGIAGIGAALITANAAKGIGQIVKEGGKLKTFMVGLPSALKGGSGVLGMVSSWGTLASLAVGGITAAKKISAMAEANDVLIIPHNPLGPVSTAACLQICACIPNLGIQELPGFCLNGAEDAMVKKPFVVEGGCLMIPDAPGIGIELADDASELYPLNDRGGINAKRMFDNAVKDW